MTYQQAATVSRQYRETWLQAAPYLTPRERAAIRHARTPRRVLVAQTASHAEDALMRFEDLRVGQVFKFRNNVNIAYQITAVRKDVAYAVLLSARFVLPQHMAILRNEMEIVKQDWIVS